MASKTSTRKALPARVVTVYRAAIAEDPQGEYAVFARQELVKHGADVSDLPAYDETKPVVSYGAGETGRRPVVRTYQPGEKIDDTLTGLQAEAKRSGQAGDTRTARTEPKPTAGELRFIERLLAERNLITVQGGVNLNQVLMEKYRAGTLSKRQARELGDWLKRCPYKGQQQATVPAPAATDEVAKIEADIVSVNRRLADPTCNDAEVRTILLDILDDLENKLAAAAKSRPAKPVRPATPKQLENVVREGARRQYADERVARTVEAATAGQAVTFDDASHALDVLFNAPFQPRGGQPAEEGMYARTETVDGEQVRVFYKVQIAHHGSGRPYAKQLTRYQDGEWGWERAPGMVNKLRPTDKLSLAEAQEFGKLYGVCCCCGTILTDEDSIAEGIGPICKDKL